MAPTQSTDLLPATGAQIHVPRLVPSDAERRVAAHAAARAVLGGTLLVGAGVLAITAEPDGPAVLVLPAVWLLGLSAAAAIAAWPRAQALVDERARWSWALLYAGLAMVAPLTLHLLPAAHLWAPHAGDVRDGFATWVQISIVLVGHTHLVFAVLCAWRGFRMDRPRADRRPGLVVIWLAVVGVTLFDFAFLSVYALLPVAYVAVTGALLLWILSRVERRLERRSTGARRGEGSIT